MTTRNELTELIEQRESKELDDDKILQALKDYWDLMEELDFCISNIDEQLQLLRRILKE